jgi:integrase
MDRFACSNRTSSSASRRTSAKNALRVSIRSFAVSLARSHSRIRTFRSFQSARRSSEAFALTWGGLDLKRGMVRLDKNKTDDPRAWALDAGTARALAAYRKLFRSEAQPDELVFQDPQGRRHSPYGAAALLRSHLEAVGLKRERPELFESTPERKRMHDLRGTFVTIALASGKSEAWISDRTGHGSSVMINAYKRTARGFEELNAGSLTPLDLALPELRGVTLGPPLPEGWATISKNTEKNWRPQGDSNPCYSLERAVSWAGLDDGDLVRRGGKIVCE